MPELPEVETVVRILNGFVPNKTIKDIRIFHEKSVLTPAHLFKDSLIGETFLPCTRIGKFIIFHLTHEKVVISHLRMEISLLMMVLFVQAFGTMLLGESAGKR